MSDFKHIGLFEGIGGFSLAARWAGWETIAWCEWNEFGQRNLRYHFPEAEGFGDITKTDFTKYANKIDIITGGFPCQPYSTAGKRLGKEDARHLWPEMLRAIREVKPAWVVGENVRGLVSWNGGLVFDEVQSDLENEGYEVFPVLLPACAVNAPHKRERIWFVAYSASNRRTRERSGFTIENWQTGSGETRELERGFEGLCASETFTNSNDSGLQTPWTEQQTAGVKQYGELDGTFPDTSSGRRVQNNEQQQPNKPEYVGTGWERFPTQSPVCSRNDGLSSRLDGITFPKWRSESIKAAGNAIVPQVAYQIFKVINGMRSLK